MDNPEQHFHIDGVKYATLEVVRRVKSRRARDEQNYLKDLSDLDLIDAHVQSTRLLSAAGAS